MNPPARFVPRALRAVPLAAIALAAVAIACEPRIEEPLPPSSAPPPPAAPPAITPASGAASGSSAAPAGDAGRCVRATPDTPARTARVGSDPRCPRDPEKAPKLRAGKITFQDANDKSVTVQVEITENDHDRQRGLMYKTSMPDDRGMIFRMEEKSDHSFWMHNTCISLDMLFIDDDGTIVGIEESTPTMDDSTFRVGCPSTYVLELNGGWTRKHGVKAGQRAKLEGIEPAR